MIRQRCRIVRARPAPLRSTTDTSEEYDLYPERIRLIPRRNTTDTPKEYDLYPQGVRLVPPRSTTCTPKEYDLHPKGVRLAPLRSTTYTPKEYDLYPEGVRLTPQRSTTCMHFPQPALSTPRHPRSWNEKGYSKLRSLMLANAIKKAAKSFLDPGGQPVVFL